VRIAIVGSGIGGLVCARNLHAEHHVTVFEAGSRVGGHSHTVTIEHEGRSIDVDTGFIVYNDRNYPRFTKLLGDLGVETVPTTMSFGIRDDRTGLEYGGSGLNALFAQRRNLFRPSHHAMIRGVLRFFEEAPGLIEEEPEDITLGAFLEKHGYGGVIAERFALPMGAAIWSSPTPRMLDFPARFFVTFFHNHGMLTVKNRPQWRTVVGGSRRYVERLVAAFEDRVRINAPVEGVARETSGVRVRVAGEAPERFDEVILACHTDQALRMLEDPSDAEREILSAMPYQGADCVLHHDASVLPRARRAWSAWNARVGDGGEPGVRVTYNMTMLQHLGTREPVCVSLNQTDEIDPGKVFARMVYHHPVYTVEGMRARGRYAEIGGVNRTHFCGAAWFNGFHEDGVRSAERVCSMIGAAV